MSDEDDNKLYAYTLSSKARNTGEEFSLHADNADAQGIWSDDTTIWVADSADDKVYAYALSDGTRQDGTGSTTDLEFALGGSNTDPRGLWSDGDTMYVVDSADDKIYDYALPAQAPALPAVTLVSNTGMSVVYTLPLNATYTRRAQSFTTGSNSGGYNLTSIGVNFYVAPSQVSDVTVTIRENNSGDPSDTVFATLTNPGSITANAVSTFTAPANTMLVASTTYFVHVERKSAATGTFSISAVHSGSEDTGAAAGWSIGDDSRRYSSNAWGKDSDPRVLLIQVTGSAVGSEANAAATGEPTISGTNLVGQTQTANKGSIADADGLPLESTFTYQWIRVTLGIVRNTEADITGATSKTYTTVAADAGKKLKVKVGFTDNAGNDESRPSALSRMIGYTSCTPAAPQGAIWSACLTVEHGGGGTYGYEFVSPTSTLNFGALSDTEFTVGGTTYTVNNLQTTSNPLVLGFTSAPGNAASDWTLHIGSARQYDLSAATNGGTEYRWVGSGQSWSSAPVRSVWLTSTAAVSNNAPVFPATETGARSVAENTASGQNVGSPVAATDTDTGDTLTYSLEGADSGSFTIVSASGQIQTSAALNHEAKSSYSVTVKVNDGTVDATKAVTISVTDVDEPPDQPAAPAVSAKSGADRQPERELERARQHRAPGHRRLQRAVPDRDHRVVHQPQLQRGGHVHHHRGTHRRHRIRGAGAGPQP